MVPRARRAGCTDTPAADVLGPRPVSLLLVSDPTASHTPPQRTPGAINPGPVLYKGEPLEPARGPGLGCFRFQLVALVILIVLTPLSVGRVPDVVTALLLFATIGILLVSGQTIIFLLRLVAADRRGRREPLAPRSPTVGQLEDAGPAAPNAAAGPTAPNAAAVPAAPNANAATDAGPESPADPT